MTLLASTTSVAIIVALSTLVSPLLLAVLMMVINRSTQKANWAREDELEEKKRVAAELAAEKAAQAAEALRADNKLLRGATEEVARLQAESTTQTQERLDHIDAQGKQIHTLVNSNLMASNKRTLGAMRAQLVSLEELMEMRLERGVKPSTETKAAVAVLQDEIAALEESITHVAEQTALAEQEKHEAGEGE